MHSMVSVFLVQIQWQHADNMEIILVLVDLLLGTFICSFCVRNVFENWEELETVQTKSTIS